MAALGRGISRAERMQLVAKHSIGGWCAWPAKLSRDEISPAWHVGNCGATTAGLAIALREVARR